MLKRLLWHAQKHTHKVSKSINKCVHTHTILHFKAHAHKNLSLWFNPMPIIQGRRCQIVKHIEAKRPPFFNLTLHFVDFGENTAISQYVTQPLVTLFSHLDSEAFKLELIHKKTYKVKLCRPTSTNVFQSASSWGKHFPSQVCRATQVKKCTFTSRLGPLDSDMTSRITNGRMPWKRGALWVRWYSSFEWDMYA